MKEHRAVSARIAQHLRFARQAFFLGTMAVALLAAGSRTQAQTLYGSIVGSVLDSSGAVIPDALVTITQTETNDTRTARTNSSGGYTLSTIPTGTYKVSVAKAGFSTFETAHVDVRVNTTVRVDAAMLPGTETQTVTVNADAAQLQSDRADVSHEVTNQSLEELPQPTRTYQGLIGLMPGVNPPSASTGGTNNPMRSMVIQANGTSASGTNVRVDGVSATNPWVQFYSTAVPSTDAIQTVNVVTGSADADQGMVNGAAVNVQIKTGTTACTARFTSTTSTICSRLARTSSQPRRDCPSSSTTTLGAPLGAPSLRISSSSSAATRGTSFTKGTSTSLPYPPRQFAPATSLARQRRSTIRVPGMPTGRAGPRLQEIRFRPTVSAPSRKRSSLLFRSPTCPALPTTIT